MKILISLVHPREIPTSTDFTTAFRGLIHVTVRKRNVQQVCQSHPQKGPSSPIPNLFNPWYENTTYWCLKASQCHQEYRYNSHGQLCYPAVTQKRMDKNVIVSSASPLEMNSKKSCTLKDQKVHFLLEVQEMKMYTFHSLRTQCFLGVFQIIQTRSWAAQLYCKGRFHQIGLFCLRSHYILIQRYH